MYQRIKLSADTFGVAYELMNLSGSILPLLVELGNHIPGFTFESLVVPHGFDTFRAEVRLKRYGDNAIYTMTAAYFVGDYGWMSPEEFNYTITIYKEDKKKD